MTPTSQPLNRWNTYEILWFLFFTSIAITLCILWENSLFDFSVFLSGVFCVLLAAKGNVWTYVFGMYNTLAYAYTVYTNDLFGEVYLNLFFFVPTNIMGYLLWKPKLNGLYVKMRAMSLNWILLTILICIVGTIGLGYILALNPKQNTPYIDATTDVLNIIATILMMYRYREQWLFFILLNVFNILMWSIRAANGSAEGPLMIVMWSAFLINAGYGYWNWSRGTSASLSDRNASTL
jgi:nicotinamide mononucleotide transporter